MDPDILAEILREFDDAARKIGVAADMEIAWKGASADEVRGHLRRGLVLLRGFVPSAAVKEREG